MARRSAGFSPGLKSTSQPRSEKISTARGESSSEMSTLGLAIHVTPSKHRHPDRGAQPRVEGPVLLLEERSLCRPSGSVGMARRRLSRRLAKLSFDLAVGPIEPRQKRFEIRPLHGG